MWTYRSASVFVVVMFLVVGTQAAESEPETPPARAMDPRVSRARELKDIVLEQEASLAKQQEEVFEATRRALEQLDPETLENAQETLDGLRELTRILHTVGEDLLLRNAQIEKSVEEHRSTLASGEQVYLDAARAAEQWAKEAVYNETRDNYLIMAETWEYFAGRLSENARLLGTQEAHLRNTLAYLKETVTFLERLHAHLSTLFRLDTTAERERYLKNLEDYIRSFEHFQSLFRELHEELTTHTLKSTLQQAPSTELQRDPPAKPADECMLVTLHTPTAPPPAASVSAAPVYPLGAVGLVLSVLAGIGVRRLRRRRIKRLDAMRNSFAERPAAPAEAADSMAWSLNGESGREVLVIEESTGYWAKMPIGDCTDMAKEEAVDVYRPSGEFVAETVVQEITCEGVVFLRRIVGLDMQVGDIAKRRGTRDTDA